MNGKRNGYHRNGRNGLIDHSRSAFTPGSLMNLGAIVITGIVGFFAFYYTTNDKLALHEKEIAQEQVVREKLRDEFLANSKLTAEGIAKLNTQAAVQGEQTAEIVKSLDKISGQLSSLTNGRQGR